MAAAKFHWFSRFTVTAAPRKALPKTRAFKPRGPKRSLFFPRGIPVPADVDPQGLQPGWQRNPGEVNDRDLKFVDALLAKLRLQFPVDDQRIFAIGFSNGAFFDYLLWVERPKVFAGFAPVAGLPRYSGNPTVPKPAVQIGGRADKLVHIEDVERHDSCPQPRRLFKFRTSLRAWLYALFLEQTCTGGQFYSPRTAYLSGPRDTDHC